MSGSDHKNLTALDRSRGCLMGLAVGDAVGTTNEFRPRGSFTPITDLIGGGPFNLQPGQWTDDTSMALCLAESLLVCRGFDLEDQIQRYVRWADHGYMSSTGTCFDIGITTSEALHRYKSIGIVRAGSTDFRTAGNGSIMRMAPVVIRYQYQPKICLDYCVEQSKTTHRAQECLDACRILGEIVLNALQGKNKEMVAEMSISQKNLSKGMQSLAKGVYKEKTIDQISGSGYVVESLEAALWCFHQTDNFRDCILMAANLGQDADTTAAIAGQVGGCFYGLQGIPKNWVDMISMKELILEMATNLYENACSDAGAPQ